MRPSSLFVATLGLSHSALTSAEDQSDCMVGSSTVNYYHTTALSSSGSHPSQALASASTGTSTNAQTDLNFSLSHAQISPRSIVSDACASYATLEQLNSHVKPVLDDLVTTTDFFSHYRLNLFNKRCPFWNDEAGTCGNRACAVETLEDEKDIPEIWRAKELGKLEGPVAKHPAKSQRRERPPQKPLQGSLGDNIGESCVMEEDDEFDERDYCVPEDESATSKGDYVSLLRNPERFTGYAGVGARQVWDTIYSENCFQRSSFPHSANLGKASPAKGPAVHDFKQVLQAVSRQQVFEHGLGSDNANDAAVSAFGDEECLEKRVFYRVVSGMHASINTHLCWDYFNQFTGEWTRNLDCYINRLYKFPDRISNLYFNYALVSRAIAKLGPHLQGPGYTFCTGDPSEDSATRAKVLAVTEGAASVPHLFDESLMFKNGEGPSLKEDFRNRFRNVSRVMDCVGCDKCRLWGKLQTAGYGTALKVLFEFDNGSDEIPLLTRTEVVALFNTYARLSNSMMAIREFRAMVDEKEQSSSSSFFAAPQTPADNKISNQGPVSEKKIPAKPVAEETSSVAMATKTGPDGPGTTKPAVYVEEWEEYEYWEPAETGSSNINVNSNGDSSSESPDEPQRNTADSYSQKRREFDEELERKMLKAKKINIKKEGSSAWDELAMTWEVIKYIFEMWIAIPRAIFVIIVSETIRAWQFFLGLPVHPRVWRYQAPDSREL
ncbi:Endoplasmic oxidoreductin-1 [Ceratocystis platani]|uniref:Endoplasmic oxidoreductin-1 n=1 Tax=Ceratocystis fimbriata f. sp. platani TaxID=88771 RepID=A0A0F8B8D5_CERFI|nr:Endoplasmic oxidoreductin-1 [Ceratocystis platani]